MVLHCSTVVSTEDEVAEDDEYNDNYKDNITEKHKATRQKKYVSTAKYLDDEEKVESKGKNVLTEPLLYDSVICTERPI